MSPFGAPAAPGPVAPAQAPAPPPGPGVAPPFVAPPTDRDPKTVWLRIGVSALLLVFCCVGGVAGFGVVLAGTSRQLEQQAIGVVDDYLGALKGADYAAAYELLCRTVTRDLSRDEFADRERARAVTDYTVRDVRTAQELIVTASVVYGGQPAAEEEYLVAIEGQLRVCGER